MKFLLLGGRGFVGIHLNRHLLSAGHSVELPARDFVPDPTINYGHVIYCIGLTADFREYPYETIDAHINVLRKLLPQLQCDSFLYLSSTRIYRYCDTTKEENFIKVDSADPDQLYNLSKLMGESLVLALSNPSYRIARLSNVVGSDYGSSNFLTQIFSEAMKTGKTTFRTSLQSEKDFVNIEQVCNLLEKISLNGRHRIYNIANGMNITNLDIAELVKTETGAEVSFLENAPTICFPTIDVDRIKSEFDHSIETSIDYLKPMLKALK